VGSLQYRLAAFFAIGIENVNASFLNTTSWQILVTSSATRQVAFTDILTACETDSFFRNYLLVAMSDIAWSPVLNTNASDTAGNSTVCKLIPCRRNTTRPIGSRYPSGRGAAWPSCYHLGYTPCTSAATGTMQQSWGCIVKTWEVLVSEACEDYWR
jgi:hypothetical protein